MKILFYIDYKFIFQPLPIDSINKYWGEDPIFLKHDETLQKQSYDQANKNFWSFIDHNLSSDNSYTGFETNGINSNSQSFQGNSVKSGFSQSGFMGSASNSNKITGLTYQEAKTRAGLK